MLYQIKISVIKLVERESEIWNKKLYNFIMRRYLQIIVHVFC